MTLMQMGLELMTHILYCEERKRAMKRYVRTVMLCGKRLPANKSIRYWMLSQHFDEIYLTWAELDDGYIGYIDYLLPGYHGLAVEVGWSESRDQLHNDMNLLLPSNIC
jgi:hypothetical protein